MEGLAVLVVLIIILWAFAASQRAKNKRLADARRAYQESLNQLKQNPTDADLKQQTLALGRAYSNLTRDQKGVTMFDEVALSNDINAASAGASTHSRQQSASLSTEAKLSKLADLKAKGLISEEEYQTQRSKILNEL